MKSLGKVIDELKQRSCVSGRKLNPVPHRRRHYGVRIVFVSILPMLPGEANRAAVGCILALLALMISVNLKPYQKEVFFLHLM